MISYREQRPCAALREVVECFWSMRSGETAEATRGAPIERILPDGCVEIVLHLGDPFRRFTTDGDSESQPPSFVVGPSTGFLLIQPGNRVDTLGVRLRPGAARQFLHGPLHEHAESITPLPDVIGSGADPLVGTLLETGSEARRFQILESLLLARLAQARPGPPELRHAIGAALERRGQLSVTALAQLAGIGRRQLERAFLVELGLRPKSFLRLLRFQGVFAAVPRGGAIDWAGLALDCGYADQSHLIRDFRSFSGETPASLLRSEGRLSRHFTSKERLRVFFGADLQASHSFYPARRETA